MASGQPFASRSYAGTKLPDRSANANAMPFSASSFSRHRPMGVTAPADYPGVEGPKPPQQSSGPPAATQSQGPPQDANPLNRLTEEQREEINEAVRDPEPISQRFARHMTSTSRAIRRWHLGPARPNLRQVKKKTAANSFKTVHTFRPRPRPPPRLPRTPRRLPSPRLHPNKTRTHLPPHNIRRTAAPGPTTTTTATTKRQPASA